MGARKMVTVPEGKSIASRAGRQLTLMRKALSGFLIALAAFLLLWRLDAIPLWRDETTTANWGRLLAESGVWAPRVFDGEQLIAQAADGHDFNSKLLPAMHSWLQFYVAGIGFKLLGVGTFTARLPFVLIGAACLFGPFAFCQVVAVSVLVGRGEGDAQLLDAAQRFFGLQAGDVCGEERQVLQGHA